MELSDWLNVTILALAIIAGCGLVYIILRKYSFGGFAWRSGAIKGDAIEARVTRDWMTTGRIDFAGAWEKLGDEHTPHELYIRVEETRVTENIGGDFNIDRRWRRATLNEARQVVTRYHQFLNEHPEHARVSDPIKTESPAFGDLRTSTNC
jgi:hypothetical protein